MTDADPPPAATRRRHDGALWTIAAAMLAPWAWSVAAPPPVAHGVASLAAMGLAWASVLRAGRGGSALTRRLGVAGAIALGIAWIHRDAWEHALPAILASAAAALLPAPPPRWTPVALILALPLAASLGGLEAVGWLWLALAAVARAAAVPGDSAPAPREGPGLERPDLALDGWVAWLLAPGELGAAYVLVRLAAVATHAAGDAVTAAVQRGLADAPMAPPDAQDQRDLALQARMLATGGLWLAIAALGPHLASALTGATPAPGAALAIALAGALTAPPHRWQLVAAGIAAAAATVAGPAALAPAAALVAVASGLSRRPPSRWWGRNLIALAPAGVMAVALSTRPPPATIATAIAEVAAVLLLHAATAGLVWRLTQRQHGG